MDEQIFEELMRRLGIAPRPTPPLAQLFRDLAFSTTDIPVDTAGRDVTGPFPDFRAAGMRQNRTFNPRAIAGMENLAQFFEGAEPRRDIPQDVTAVAHERLIEKIAAQDLLDEIARPAGRRSMREEFAGRESELGTAEETSHLGLLMGAGGVARGVGKAVARRGAQRLAQREAGDIFAEAERRVFSDISRRAQERAGSVGRRAVDDPIAELRRLLGPEGPQ